jgi:protein-tyrosine phosphatase
MADPALLAERRLVWPACDNVRDLGGLPAANANVTRHGSIVRADCLTGLTDAGWHALAVHGVRTIIDLRDPDDRSRAPHTLPDSVARAGGLDLLSLPLRCAGPRVDALLAGAETLEESYVITVEHCQANVAAILRAIVGARPGGIAIHCQSGRDRTAIIAALLLALAGVPAYVIAADYFASQGELWPRWEAQVAAAGGDEEAAGRHLRPLLQADTMLVLLRHLEARYGDVAGYMAAIGLTAEEREALADRLLERRAQDTDASPETMSGTTFCTGALTDGTEG